MILMLEDNAERIRRFRATLKAFVPAAELKVWRDAHAMIREATPLLSASTLISLDHDLDALPGGGDPGDGVDVVRFLLAQPVVRPVIVHSSNHDRSNQMLGDLDLAGWPHERVAPIGDDWIEVDWRRKVSRLLS